MPHFRRTGLAAVPYRLIDELPKVGGKRCLRVYLAIQQLCDEGDSWCTASMRSIGLRIGSHHHDVSKSMDWLVSNGWVQKVERPGKPTVFCALLDGTVEAA